MYQIEAPGGTVAFTIPDFPFAETPAACDKYRALKEVHMTQPEIHRLMEVLDAASAELRLAGAECSAPDGREAIVRALRVLEIYQLKLKAQLWGFPEPS